MKLFRGLPLALALLAAPASAPAHPLDVYLQATLVAIDPDKIRLDINLTPGVEVAERVLGLIDRNRDGVISSDESSSYAEVVKRELIARLDQRDVDLKLVALSFPDPAELRTGWGIIQMEFAVTTGALAAGQHKFELKNRHQPVASAYLFNAAQPSSGLIQIIGQKRNQNQSAGEITFACHPPPNPDRTAGIALWLVAIVVFLIAAVCLSSKRQKADHPPLAPLVFHRPWAMLAALRSAP